MKHSIVADNRVPLETGAIWEEFHQRLLAFIRRRVANQHDAEDILQDVFTRIHTNLSRLKNGESVTAWIYRITHNATADYYRERAKATEGVAELRSEVKSGRTPLLRQGDEGNGVDSDGSSEFARCVEPLLSQLPERYREAITMTELRGLTQKETAQRIGLSVSGMKSRVQRARKKMKDLLLNCCAVHLDRRHSVIDFQPRDPGSCGKCGCG